MDYKDSKLIIFLKSFTKEELNDFQKFLSLPYFKKDRDLVPFLLILKNYYPDFSKDNFSEEIVFKQIYPDRKYRESKSKSNFRALSSHMLKAVEEYLFISGIKNNQVLKNRIVLKQLLDRNIHKYFEQYLSSAFDNLKKDEDSDGMDGLERFYLERLSSRHYATVLDFKNFFSHSFKSAEHISSYFLLDLLRTAKTKLFMARHRNLETGKNFIDSMLGDLIDIEKFLELYKDSQDYLYLCFHYYTYKCLLDFKNPDYFNKAKKVFFDNKSLISRYDKIFFYADLINILNASSKKDNAIVKKELFSLYKSCLEDKAYKVSNKDFMQPDFYRNVILTITYLKEYDWGIKFVKTYSDELRPEYRDNMKNYSMAVIYYGQNEFEKSLECISNVKYDLLHFKIDVKILMLKIFYELNLTEQAYSLADTFKHYIKNIKEMPYEVKLSYNNFLKYYLFLVKQNTNISNKHFSNIKTEMSEEKSLFHSVWLMEKAELLNN